MERLVSVLERSGAAWCMIGGLAVNHWAAEPMATADVDIVIAATELDRCVESLVQVGFRAERFEWSVNLQGESAVSVQISTDAFYRGFPDRGIETVVHGIPMRVASREDTLAGKLAAWKDPRRRASKRRKDLLDILRLVESHPDLMDEIPAEHRGEIKQALESP